MFGAPGWTRTTDLRLRSPLLYPAELPGHAPFRVIIASLSLFEEMTNSTSKYSQAKKYGYAMQNRR